jgi:hypothetical protein
MMTEVPYAFTTQEPTGSPACACAWDGEGFAAAMIAAAPSKRPTVPRRFIDLLPAKLQLSAYASAESRMETR